MAKPTVRIPEWASGGTTTDPGAGKEATGWLVSERPPAEWWNWILNALGQWASYFVAKTDEMPVRLAYTAFLELGSSPQVLWEGGDTAASFAADGNNIRITLTNGVVNGYANTSIQVTQGTSNLGTYPVLGGFMLNDTTLELSAFDLSNTALDLNQGTSTPRVHVTIFEPTAA